MDVGNNYSVLDHPNICFIYEYVGSKDSEREQSSFVSNVLPVMLLLLIKDATCIPIKRRFQKKNSQDCIAFIKCRRPEVRRGAQGR